MGNVKLDFVVFLGDPDEGAVALPSGKALDPKLDTSMLNFSEGVYGAISIEKAGARLGELKPDPALTLVTSFVRTVPYVIDGEPETALLTESEFGFMFEPAGDEVLISFFAGDAYEPDEYLVEPEPMQVEAFADQVTAMADRLVALINKCNPDLITKDDYAKTLLEFLELAKSRSKTLRLERERGVRR